MGTPACQSALFLSVNQKWRLEMGSWIPANSANSIILLVSFLQNAIAIHILIIRSGADLFVNLHMAFYSLPIYMQESQRPGAGMCGCLCTVKWQTFFKCLSTLSLCPLSLNLKPPTVLLLDLRSSNPSAETAHSCHSASYA